MRVMDKFLDVMGFGEAREDDFIGESESVENLASEWNPRQRSRAQLVSISSSKEQNKVILLEPHTFDDCQQIADHLKSKKIILINLENIDKTTARRIIDFVGGTAYALDGCLQKVGAGIIIAAPSNVAVSGELNSESQPKEVFAWINAISKSSEGRRSLY
ncbi:MAG TPA: cell division protein SepF [Clostridia bacterium]|nr:cell division protein SepF [Clostridia bacterium]